MSSFVLITLFLMGSTDGWWNEDDTDTDTDTDTDMGCATPPPGKAFYLAGNGVTVCCPNADLGDSGEVNGRTYTRRDEAWLRNVASSASDYETACTSGITNMYAVFAANTSFNGDISSWDTGNVQT